MDRQGKHMVRCGVEVRNGQDHDMIGKGLALCTCVPGRNLETWSLPALACTAMGMGIGSVMLYSSTPTQNSSAFHVNV